MLKDLDRILASVGDGVVALDNDLRYVFANDAAVQMTGLSREAVLGRTPWEIFPPEVVEQTVPHIRSALTTQRTVRYDAYFPGGGQWFENRLYPSVNGVTIFFTDVTARRKAEEALRRSEEEHRLLVSLTDAVRGLRDPDAVMFQFVSRVGRHFGVTRCTYGEIDASQEHVTVSRDYVDGVRSVAGRHRLDDFGPALISDLKGGRTIAVTDVADDPRTRGASAQAAFAAIETRSLLCVPLVKEGRFVALFVLHHSAPRGWSADDVALMEQIAERTWFAVVTARAEASLRESRDVLSLAMRAGRMGAWARALPTNEVWWSRELEELFGLPPGAFEGTEAGFFGYVHEEDRPAVEAAVARAIATRTDYDVEFRFRHADGSWRWMEGRGRAVYENGSPRSLYGLGIDITERKAAEHALSVARRAADAHLERLSLALAAARLGDWSVDARTGTVSCSPRAAEILGIAPGLLTTREAMRERMHPADRERVRAVVDASIAQGSDYVAEYRLSDGTRERWVSASGRAVYGEDGEVRGLIGVLQDITTDRLLVRLDDAVRALGDPEQIIYTAATMVGRHLGVSRCAYATVEADEDTCVVTGNYTAAADGIVGRHVLHRFGDGYLRAMRNGEPWIVADALADPRLTENDRLAYEAIGIRATLCVPILKAGRLVAGMALHSTTPREWTDGELRLLQQVASRCWESLERARVERERAGLLEAAEAANRAKDEFLAMLGHELRNPLSPILTALQLMRLRGDVTAARERTVIERQVLHLTRLVDDLLDVSRIARGKVELKIEVVELGEVVTRAIEVASPLLEGRSHTLTVEVPRTGLAVRGDPARLSQVVSNLLTNAAKYTPPGGRIALRAAMEEGEVALSVQDSGIGIPADVLPTIFDLFVQGRQSIDRAGGGLGLGLSIARNLVERHGGTLTASSAGAGAGSRFVVRLPAAGATPATAEAAADGSREEAVSGARRRILVVDDNYDAAEMLSEVLRLKGFDTRVAHDAAQAIELAGQVRFDAAFLDIGLPVMDGYELAGRLREMPAFERVPLIAVTGYGQESDREKAGAAGFDHHLVKPVDFGRLETVLATLRPSPDSPVEAS